MDELRPTESNSNDTLYRSLSAARIKEFVIQSLLFFCALLSVLVTAGIIIVLFKEAVFGKDAFFREISFWRFITDLEWGPRWGSGYGILPLLNGTLLVTAIAALIGVPIGLTSAIYLSEYATPASRDRIKPTLEILAGVPTIVYGFFAVTFVTPFVLRPIFSGIFGLDVGDTNILSAGIIVGLMIIPMVSSLSEDVLQAVPKGLREAGYALGATKFEVSTKIVVPAALSGILAAILLAISRAIGETMAVALAAGSTPNLVLNPLQQGQTMTAFIMTTAGGENGPGTIPYQSMYAVGLALFSITLLMNILSQAILNRFREEYQ